MRNREDGTGIGLSACPCPHADTTESETASFNPFTAMLKKRSVKVPSLKPLRLVCLLRASAPKRISIKMHSIKSEICYRTIKYTICRPCMCALFCPETEQAAAVKWLKTQQLERGPRGVCVNSRVDVLASCVHANCV